MIYNFILELESCHSLVTIAKARNRQQREPLFWKHQWRQCRHPCRVPPTHMRANRRAVSLTQRARTRRTHSPPALSSTSCVSVCLRVRLTDIVMGLDISSYWEWDKCMNEGQGFSSP